MINLTEYNMLGKHNILVLQESAMLISITI